MSHQVHIRLSFAMKLGIALAGAVALAMSPVAVGMAERQAARQQDRPVSQKPLTFEAASVKPTSVPSGVILAPDGRIGVSKGSGIQIPPNTGGPGTDDPGRIHYPLISLKQLLRRAWDSYYEIDGPGWLDSQAVTVDATMPPGTTKAQFQEMLRNLITERFGLQYHAGKREITGYALVVAKGGPKMKESADQRDSDWARLGPAGRRGPDGFPTLPPITGKTMGEFGMGDRSRIFAQQVTMQNLVESLARHLKTIVTDASGLTKKYDFTLTYASLEPLEPPANMPKDLEPVPDIFAALQSQLGLKLERKPVPVEVFVVDHMEKKPSEN